MKHLILGALLMASAALVSGADTPVQARIPFAFEVKGVSAAPGTYVISFGNAGVTSFRLGGASFLGVAQRDHHETKAFSLVFHRYADHYVLRAINLADGGRMTFPATRKEKEYNAIGMVARVETVALSTKQAD